MKGKEEGRERERERKRERKLEGVIKGEKGRESVTTHLLLVIFQW